MCAQDFTSSPCSGFCWKAMNMNSKVTREGRSGYTQTCKGYLQGNTQTSVCGMKWQSVQFRPLDKSDEAECAIFWNVFLEKKTCSFDLEQKGGCVCDPPQQAEALVSDMTRGCVRRMPLGLLITHRPCHSGSRKRNTIISISSLTCRDLPEPPVERRRAPDKPRM